MRKFAATRRCYQPPGAAGLADQPLPHREAKKRAGDDGACLVLCPKACRWHSGRDLEGGIQPCDSGVKAKGASSLEGLEGLGGVCASAARGVLSMLCT